MWFRCYGPNVEHTDYGTPEQVRADMVNGILRAFDSIDRGANNPKHGRIPGNPYWIKTPEALRPRGLADE